MNINSIIKYEGPNNVLVWKHPIEDFNTTSQLIVHESQEAILYKNGKALDLFGSGRYTLTTENIPLLREIINIPTGGETPFHCEVYFINKVDSLDILWGTSAPIPIQDPVYNIILPVGANGQFGIRVKNSRQLLVKLVGTIKEFNQKTFSSYFKGLLMTKIKDLISNQMAEKQISFLHIHSYLNEMSDSLMNLLKDIFIDYGIEIVNFYINAIVIPEDNPSYIKLKDALAKKAEMGVVGFNYQQERTFNVLEKAAENEGEGSGIMGAGLGIGMGIPLGGVMGGAMSSAITNISTNVQPQMRSYGTVICPNCGERSPKGKFCINCGYKIEENACKKCGAVLPANAKFCLECGEKV